MRFAFGSTRELTLFRLLRVPPRPVFTARCREAHLLVDGLPVPLPVLADVTDRRPALQAPGQLAGVQADKMGPAAAQVRLVRQGMITVDDARVRSSRPDELESLLR